MTTYGPIGAGFAAIGAGIGIGQIGGKAVRQNGVGHGFDIRFRPAEAAKNDTRLLGSQTRGL